MISFRAAATVAYLVTQHLWLAERVGAEPTTTGSSSSSRRAEEEDATTRQCQSDDDDEDSSSSSSCRPAIVECGLWTAASTIPGSGLGMFAGRNYDAGERLLVTGDVVIPLIDLVLHAGHDDFPFLWDEYTWEASNLWMDHEGTDETNVASPGFGSAANSCPGLNNCDEFHPLNEIPHGLHRSKDPGAGATSHYHNRITTAKVYMEEGQELFVSYGDNWFESRRVMADVPITGDYQKAQNIMNAYQRLLFNHNETAPKAMHELWFDLLMTDVKDIFQPSRVLAALPPTKEEYDQAVALGLTEQKRAKASLSLEYLQTNGTCADHIKAGPSTIRQAGRGAFANRFLPKGTVVSPVPLIHLPLKDKLLMYELEEIGEDGDYDVKDKDRTTPVGQQVMVNYCMGHPESSMLLCPYGTMNPLVNHQPTHNLTRGSGGSSGGANVKMQWALPHRSNHDPTWMTYPVEKFYKQDSAVVAVEYIATRDIYPDEEIFLDYGPEWQDAWNRHVAEWKPVEGADAYISADQWNNDLDTPLRTTFQQIEHPYPDNVSLYLRQIFIHKQTWIDDTKSELQTFIYDNFEDDDAIEVDILRWEREEDTVHSAIRYTVTIDNDKGGERKYEGLPREAFFFMDEKMTTDMFQPNAFRHPIGIPDEIFPEARRNEKVKEEA